MRSRNGESGARSIDRRDNYGAKRGGYLSTESTLLPG
jgi:hypothetical protein